MENTPIKDIYILIKALLDENKALKEELALLRKDNAELREKRLNELLNQEIDAKFPKTIVFQKRIEKYKHYLFRFLQNELIPPR
jgi:glucan phosphorylase